MKSPWLGVVALLGCATVTEAPSEAGPLIQLDGGRDAMVMVTADDGGPNVVFDAGRQLFDMARQSDAHLTPMDAALLLPDGAQPDAAPSPDAFQGIPPGTQMAESFVVGQTGGGVPIDFLMTMDNTTGMEDTSVGVERHLSLLGGLLADAGLDAHFVLITERGQDVTPTDVCIQPPMAGVDCGNSERFVHVSRRVGDNEAFEAMLRCWDACEDGNYQWHLRANSLLHVLVVTDDDADRPWAQFREQLLIRGRPEFVLHGLIGLQNNACIEEIGHQYIAGSLETGGRVIDICREEFGAASRTILRAIQTQLQRYFSLAERADPASLVIEAEIDGQRRVQQGNWRFDAANNRVIFEDSNDRPRLGDPVFIGYTTR